MMEIQVIEKTIVQKCMKDDKYGFEVPLEDIYDLLYHMCDNDSVSKYEIHEMTHESMIPYFIDNEILQIDNGQYIRGENWEKFDKLIWKKLHE